VCFFQVGGGKKKGGEDWVVNEFGERLLRGEKGEREGKDRMRFLQEKDDAGRGLSERAAEGERKEGEKKEEGDNFL